MYRVIKILTDDFQDKVTESVIWEGTNTDEISLKYPPSEVFGADRLGSHEIEDGWIRWSHRFECLNKANTWIECEDFRTRLNDDYAEIEQSIDQENRRMFPGDYMTDQEHGYLDYEEYDPTYHDDYL